MAQTLITSDDLSPLVLIITWILCIISVLCMVARVATSIIFARPIKSDGYSSLLSLVISVLSPRGRLYLLTRILFIKFLSVAQSIAVTVRALNGLGKHVTALGPTQISTYSKVSSLFANCTN